MFAASRTERVIGRITFLIISIITIKGINTGRVPEGTRCARNSVMLLIRLYEMKANQKGKANERVIARCLVAVKVNDANPTVLLNRIKINKDENIIIFIFLLFNNVENSLFIDIIIVFMVFLKGDDKTQKEGMKSTINISILIQFKDKLKIAVGSKIEKRLFIIFSSVQISGVCF